MSRRHRRGGMVDRPKASIDMNSLIDLTFLLLVTFILTIPALEQGISIILPRGKTDTLQVKEHKPTTITIDAENPSAPMALSFNRPLSLSKFPPPERQSKGKVNSNYMHFVTLTSLRPGSVRRDKLSQRIYPSTNYLYHNQ